MKLTKAQKLRTKLFYLECEKEYKNYILKEYPNVKYDIFCVIYELLKNQKRPELEDFLKLESLKDDINNIIDYYNKYHINNM